MRYLASVCAVFAVALALNGCSHEDKVIRKESTVQTVPAAPIITERRTTIERE